ncbi:hypothetical protein NHX12_020199 [Muraenolepis orangiensis]|uniref:Anoctamin dimerisation domain-containing protein n=1 Tax=Muraenolepis orangiensis TaxID=630683 RepID=A0A9Q0IUU9_9TELE|nr:hypothetical protein NHX12_020199 [Muraenolepis orangiensis]
MPDSPNDDKIPVVGSSPETEKGDRGSEGGQFFSDGRRKVDYVLVFNKRRQTVRAHSDLHDCLSTISNGNFPPPPASAAPVKSHAPGFTRLHAPWHVLSREAEFLKIKVPTKKSYELKEETGLSASMTALWAKLNQPFQPKVPAHQRGRTKLLSHCFTRDKLHLYDIKSKDTFFDNATRGRIVYEILRRTACARTCQTMGITTLIAKGVYDAAFPLHDGDFKVAGHSEERNDRQLLHEEWARYSAFYKYQPVDLIR